MERQPLQERSIFPANDNVISRKTSAIVQPVRKESHAVKPLFMSPVLPGTSSVTHNVTRLLSSKAGEESDGLFQGGFLSTNPKELFATPKGDSSAASEGKNISIFHVCMVWIEKSVTRVTDRHHEACRVMPKVIPSDRDGEIRIVGPGKTRGCPYPVCKKNFFFYTFQ